MERVSSAYSKVGSSSSAISKKKYVDVDRTEEREAGWVVRGTPARKSKFISERSRWRVQIVFTEMSYAVRVRGNVSAP